MDTTKDNRYTQYQSLITDLKNMIDTKGRGYESAQAMNDAFWEELGTHKQRMLEQIDRLDKSESEEQLAQEMTMADSIYEATRSYIAKYQ